MMNKWSKQVLVSSAKKLKMDQKGEFEQKEKQSLARIHYGLKETGCIYMTFQDFLSHLTCFQISNKNAGSELQIWFTITTNHWLKYRYVRWYLKCELKIPYMGRNNENTDNTNTTENTQNKFNLEHT